MLIRRCILVCCVLLNCSWADARAEDSANTAERQTAERMDGAKGGLQYLLYLPEKYSDSERWPLVLFLHGSGERGEKIGLVKKHGPPKLVAAGRDFPFILVSPQCPAGQRWDAKQLSELVDQIERKCRVDPSRIYLTGLSMGGGGTWSLIEREPERFAAIVPICGRGNPETANRFAGVPTWVFHGAKDRAVPLRESEQMVDAMRAAGGNPDFTVYPDAAHDSWTEAYANPDLYRWLLKQKKQ